MTHTAISKIPDSLWSLEKLEEIDPGSHIDGKCFPVKVGSSIYRNQSLRTLRLTRVEIYEIYTKASRKSHPNLTNLKVLELAFGLRKSHEESDGQVEEDPMPWIGNLRKLESLNQQSDYVTTLSADINLLPQLKALHLWCPNLRRLPRLPSSVLSLRLTSCESLCSMDLSNLQKLTTLQIVAYATSEIPGLDRLENLRELELYSLQQVKILPDLSNFSKLERLKLCGCSGLVEIQGELPQSLTELEIAFCRSLWKLPKLSKGVKVKKDLGDI